MQMLKTKRRRFFELHVKYRKVPENFSIQYNRKIIIRKRVRRAIMIKARYNLWQLLSRKEKT